MSIEARFLLERAGPSPAFVLDVSLRLSARSIGIVGASGSGKTTLLRCIAGLERPRIGQLSVAGEVWQDERRWLPVHRRELGYVFQEPSLFPHLSVRENLMFGLKRLKPQQRKISFDDAVALLGLASLLTRAPGSLSGGERQRVAIGRALLTSPKLLLMDEPLASLDVESRAQILPYFEAVQRALAVPLVYVTHAPSELARLAEQVVLLAHGKLLAVGALNELLTRADLPLFQRDDAGAVLTAQVVEQDEAHHLTHLSVGAARLVISRRELALGQPTKLLIRARDVSLSLVPPLHSSVNNVLETTVLGVHADRDPAHRLVQLDLQGTTLLARISLLSVKQLEIKPGLRVFALVKSAALVE